MVRIDVIAGEGGALSPNDLWLFAGELSDYHLGRINRRDLPATLSERMVPVRVEGERDRGRVSLLPTVVLEPGARYTLATPGWGQLAQFDVDAQDDTPLLERVWPPTGSTVGRLLVLCGGAVPAETFEVTLDPSGLPVAIEPSFGTLPDGRICVSAHLSNDGEAPGLLGLPPEAGGVLLDPTPFEIAPSSAPETALCDEGELALGPGCARVDDDRLNVRSADEPLLWALETNGSARIEPMPAAGRWVVRGLEPDREQRVWGRAISVGGAELPFDVNVRTLPERSHLVLNEVLANPLGSEPAAEWVELFNDGQSAAELLGLWLRDSAGAVELPAATIAPGEYALLVRSDFPATLSGDVPPLPGTQLVRLPLLAKGGLSNSGEALDIEDANGLVLSRFPALAARRAGVSLARTRVDAFDADAGAFAEHGAPGASPGTMNY